MSFTGNVRSFVERTGMDSCEVNPFNPCFEVNENYIVVVPSYEGEITNDVIDFIDYKDNRKHLKGFASSGNLTFDESFCINAKELSKRYEKPIILKFELEGTDADIKKFKQAIQEP